MTGKLTLDGTGILRFLNGGGGGVRAAGAGGPPPPERSGHPPWDPVDPPPVACERARTEREDGTPQRPPSPRDPCSTLRRASGGASPRAGPHGRPPTRLSGILSHPLGTSRGTPLTRVRRRRPRRLRRPPKTVADAGGLGGSLTSVCTRVVRSPIRSELHRPGHNPPPAAFLLSSPQAPQSSRPRHIHKTNVGQQALSATNSKSQCV